MAQDNKDTLGEVPRQVYAAFIVDLKATDVPADVIGRIETALLGQEKVTERDLRLALFADEQEP